MKIKVLSKKPSSEFKKEPILSLMYKNLKFQIAYIFLLLAYVNVQGQKLEYPSLRIGFTPSALANFYPGIQFSFDKGLKRSNLEIEAAYIFNSPFNARGFRIRPGIERLLTNQENSGFSVGIHLHYRWSLEYRNIIRAAPNGEYLQFFYNEKRVRHYLGPIASFKFIHKPAKRLTYEAGLGLGLANYSIVETMPLQLIPINNPNAAYISY
jgi:hypothetical protein